MCNNKHFKFYWMTPQSLPHTSVMSQGLLRYEKPYSVVVSSCN
jgi:hypothetical protein